MKHAAKSRWISLKTCFRAASDSRLKEKKRGVCYRAASAFLHFHEDPRASLRISGWGWI